MTIKAVSVAVVLNYVSYVVYYFACSKQYMTSLYMTIKAVSVVVVLNYVS
jgi:hypothetical protein